MTTRPGTPGGKLAAAPPGTLGGISHPTPADMTVEQRLAEVSHLFATAYMRLLVARRESQIPLADPTESAAPCDRVVNRSEIQHEEVT